MHAIHVAIKSAFRGAPGYDLNDALAIPNAEMKRLGVNHNLVSVAQREMYTAFARTGRSLTWDVVQKIETDALLRGGMQDQTMARTTVQRAINSLKEAGVSGPARIPWGEK